jgi:uncharacterized membrane protein YhaH (DUF805 family)
LQFIRYAIAMKYAVWFLRLIFGAWMIPAGVNHFIALFPQPMGSKPVSHELIQALLDSHLFGIVKVVELIAGVAILTGFRAPLALLICMPVSFCVFYWDAPLEGWQSRAALFGYSVLLCNVLLCLAYAKSYRAMFALRVASSPRRLALAGRLILGGWMLVNGINHFFFPLWAEPTGHQPLAAQLMAAFMHSGLLDVAMAIELLVGALLLIGIAVPAALCMLMPISTCALYWAVALEREPLGVALAVTAFALNGLLMLACLQHYAGALQKHATTLGETSTVFFEARFVDPNGRTARAKFATALLTLLAAVAFYLFLVGGRTGQWALLMLLFPGMVLLARRLLDMGRSPWLLALPAVLMLAAFIIWLQLGRFGAQLDAVVPIAALVAVSGLALWGSFGVTRAGVVRF